MTVTRVINLRHEKPPSDRSQYVYIGRPSRWGNPYSVKEFSRERALAFYRGYLLDTPLLLGMMSQQLRGKVLGCWCKPLPCHGDIIVELLNASEPHAPGTE